MNKAERRNHNNTHSPGEGLELGVVLRVEEGGVVRVVQVLVHVLSVLFEAPLEPVPGPLQGVLDLIPSAST